MTRPSLSAPLAVPDFRQLWGGFVASNLGTMVQSVGAGWLMVSIARSDDMVALVQSAATLPVMLFSIVAGAIADSFDRRRVLLIAQLFMMINAVLLTVVVTSGQITPWLLLGSLFLAGCGTALHAPSWQASVGDVVPRDVIPAAVTLNGMAVNLTRSVGPAVGGVVVAAAGAGAAFALNAVSFVPMVWALLRWKPAPAPASLPREDFGRAIWAGLRYVSMSPNLLTVIFRGFVFGLVAIAILALLPIVARDRLQGGAVTFGLLLAAFGIGAIAGGFANARMRARFSNETVVRLAFLGVAISAGLVAVSRETWATCLFLLPAGASWVLALSLFNTVVQLSTPRWVLGRTLSIYQTASFGGMTAGGWLWGTIAEGHGLPVALTIAGVVALAGAAMGLRFALPDQVALNLDPLNHFKEPDLQLELQPRSGPIMILIEYEIAQADVQAFLDAMSQRRRIRIRDGAQHWVLLRDLENPDLWKEAYHVPTWVEYVRHNHRRTQADADINARLLALNKSGNKPGVRRMIERDTVPLRDDMAIKSYPELP
ncbi:MAG: MFS transporter [Rhodobacteraceae bacterium PARR1]|nr:MAG: MFS transporter [Rhodobacteraceae bacterium PARR1]